MALTNTQLLSLGFKPSVRGRGGLAKNKKYDSLVLPLNDSDFLYTGYNPYKKQVNYKTIWKSFKDTEGNRITYQVVNLADTGYGDLKEYIERTNNREFKVSEWNIEGREGEYISQPADTNLQLPEVVDFHLTDIEDNLNSFKPFDKSDG